jgi:glycogen operon protein
MAIMLNGRTLQQSDADGNPLIDDSFLIIVNASHEGVEFALPEVPNGAPWQQIIDTENLENPFDEATAGDNTIVGGRSMKVFSDHH